MLGDADLSLAAAAAPKVPSEVPALPEPQAQFLPEAQPAHLSPETPQQDVIEEVVRHEIQAASDIPTTISMSASNSIVPAVPAGHNLPATKVPALLVASQPSQQGLSLQQPSGIALASACSRHLFDSMMDRELPFSVFNKMLSGAPAPFVGSPELRADSMDTSVNPTWLLFGWDHSKAAFTNTYDVNLFGFGGMDCPWGP